MWQQTSGPAPQQQQTRAARPAATSCGLLLPSRARSLVKFHCQPVGQQQQQQAGASPSPAAPTTLPQQISTGAVARSIQARRSVVDDEALHRPLGLVAFGAYVLGSAASLVDMPGPAWLPALTGAVVGGVFATLNRYCNARLWRPPASPLNVVVTGSTRGLGKALAREFLAHGDSVIVTGRTPEAVAQSIREIKQELAGFGLSAVGTGPSGSRKQRQQQPTAAAAAGSSGPRLYGVVCDVTKAGDVANLAAEAQVLLGTVDVWICNAGYSGAFKPFLAAEPSAIESVVKTNLLGTLLCAREAGRLMLTQELGGHIFMMDGAGADGSATPQYAAYGATKASFPQLAATLGRELDRTQVGVHVLSPGMMLTDLLLEGATSANKQAFNILCEHPETVAAFLVPRVRSTVSCGLNGTYTKYLTPASAVYRLLTAPARIGRFFDASGNAVYAPEHERILGKGAKATARQQALARARTSSLGMAYSLSLALSFVAMVAMEGHASAFTGH